MLGFGRRHAKAQPAEAFRRREEHCRLAPSEPPEYRSFYETRRGENYGEEYAYIRAEDHSCYPQLREFITQYGLADKRCLEIGSSGGHFQDMVEDYFGIDLSEHLAGRYHKSYARVRDDGSYPFEDEMFDGIWSFAVHEHIPDLQQALLEIVRITRPGAVVLLAPAWQCRPWMAEGYPLRPYSDFGLKGKLIKASIPLRDSVAWRSLFVFPKRIFRHLQFLAGHQFERIRYRPIQANWETFWDSDSDACNSIDPHDAVLWFESHGFECLSHPMHVSAFLVRTGGIVLRKRRAG